MKRKVVRAGLFVVICGIWLGILTEIMKPKMMDGFSDVTRKVRGFEAEESGLDYIFFGSSRMYSALNPAILWKEYGVTSYDFCCNEQGLALTYYYMEEALKRQTPKALVVDISLGGVETREPMMHLNLAYGEISSNKFEAIWDNASGTKRFDFLFPIRQWHTNWYNLSEGFFKYSFWKGTNLYRGYSYVEPDESIILPEYDYPYDMTENMELYYSEPQPEVLEWIDKMVELASKNEVELVFIVVPSGMAPQDQGYYNGIFEYVRDRSGVKCINYNLKMSGMHHLTADLATEFTQMVGADLSSMYEVGDKRGLAGYESWDESVLIYEQEMKSFQLNDIQKWSDYKELLGDDNYCIFIEQLPWNCNFETWELLKDDLEQIGIDGLSDPFVPHMGIYGMDEKGEDTALIPAEDTVIERRRDGMYYFMQYGAVVINHQMFHCNGGLRIVVWDKVLKRVVDSVLIEDESLGLHRA